MPESEESMNKKIFGLRVGTLVSFVVCVIVAICIWIYANYIESSAVLGTTTFHLTKFRG